MSGIASTAVPAPRYAFTSTASVKARVDTLGAVVTVPQDMSGSNDGFCVMVANHGPAAVRFIPAVILPATVAQQVGAIEIAPGASRLFPDGPVAAAPQLTMAAYHFGTASVEIYIGTASDLSAPGDGSRVWVF